MTTLQNVSLNCPLCKRGFKSHVVVFTNSFGGKRTDFHERAAGAQPLPYLIHSCTRCGYSGVESDFADDTEIWPELKDFVRNEVKPLFEYEGYDFPAVKYEAAAKISELQRCGARDIADLLLRAAWCCVDCGDTEAERYYRRLAAKKFEDALALFDGIDPEERATITYLIGELWRRIGDRDLASLWFGRVESEVVDRETQEWTIRAAEQQNGEYPREWFG
jgi:uncharacterized protein (DUF2225 family)